MVMLGFAAVVGGVLVVDGVLCVGVDREDLIGNSVCYEFIVIKAIENRSLNFGNGTLFGWEHW